MNRRKRRYPGAANLLTREEIKQHLILIEDITKRVNKKRIPKEIKTELEKQIRNLNSELWIHKHTRKAKLRKEKTYKGAEF